MSVVIPTYGSARLPVLRRTLNSLVHAARPAGLNDIWLVENGPLAGAKAVYKEFCHCLPGLRYLHEPHLGLSSARNAGVRSCEGDFIVFFDNDVRVGESTLLAYEGAFEKYGPHCFYGGAVYPEYDTPPPEWLHRYLPPSVVYWHVADSTGPIDEPLLLGGNHALSRIALQAVGGYDPIGATGSGGGLGEESRLQKCIAAIGGQVIYIADAPVWHYVPPPECSPRWTLNRKFRDGLTEGLLHTDLGQRRLFGAPRWMWSYWAVLVMRCLVTRLAGRNLQQRFDLELERAYYAGLLAGCRQGGKRHGV